MDAIERGHRVVLRVRAAVTSVKPNADALQPLLDADVSHAPIHN
jgi:hypothetical protein